MMSARRALRSTITGAEGQVLLTVAKDFQAAVEPVRAFAATVRQARVLEYEGRGHFMFVEDPERFARDVSAFLREPARRR
jgi:proline iminopeptidase